MYARTLATDVLAPDGEVLLKAGVDLGDVNIRLLIDNGITAVKVRSVLTCEATSGTCAMCYGRSLASPASLSMSVRLSASSRRSPSVSRVPS